MPLPALAELVVLPDLGTGVMDDEELWSWSCGGGERLLYCEKHPKMHAQCEAILIPVFFRDAVSSVSIPEFFWDFLRRLDGVTGWSSRWCGSGSRLPLPTGRSGVLRPFGRRGRCKRR